MTLDISQFIANSIRTQSKIHHLDVNVKAVKKDQIPASITSVIEKDYGEKYLNDADYVSFFWGVIDKDQIEKLFNVVDKALGKSANKLTNTDFKKLNVEIDEPSDVEDDKEEIDVEVDDEEETNDEDVEVNDEEEEEEEEIDDDELNEDEEVEEEIEVKEENVQIKTSYFFLKITTK